jgi:amino acid adenylation domain-containing protein
MNDMQVINETRGFSNEDLDLLAYVLAEEGVELDDVPLIQRRDAGVEIPLSFAQQRLWFLEQLQAGNPVYHLPTAVRVTGPLNATALEKTFDEIVRRHEILRTTFTVNGSPQQIVAPVSRISIPVIDLSHLSLDLRNAEVRRQIREEVVSPFDLSEGPLLRTLLLRLSALEHVVVVTMHHIISDGWSSTVLVREFCELYEAIAADRPTTLAELPLQYADYTLWQRQWLQGEVLESQLSYWRRQLSNLQMLELPVDHPRPAIQSFRGARHTGVVALALCDALKTLGRGEDATLFMVLLAAFAGLLSRYSGQTAITVGTPVANRRRAELEPLIGLFVNTLVLHLDTTECRSFRELIRRAREVCLGAYAHQDVPFEKLVEELQPQRSLSHTPLFQALLVMQNVPRRIFNMEGLQLEGLGVDLGTTKFDLTLVAEESEQGLIYTFEYNTDLFDAETITRLAEHFERLLEGIVADPDRRPSSLALLSQAERRKILVEWNDTQRPYRHDISIHELFVRQVERTPDTVALVFEEQKLTYSQLNERANQLAHRLRRAGVRPDVLVGVLMERSVEMVVALLGTLKAGGAYLPLDPEYPRKRLDFLFQDAGAPVVLTQAKFIEKLPQYSGTLISVDSEWESIAQERRENPPAVVGPHHLAYVIYTSGSTGQPKGVMIPHQGISNRLHWMQEAYQLTQSDCVLQKTPFGFDVSVWEFFWPLMTGARLVLARPGGHQDSAYLVKLIREQKVTTLHFVPPMLKVFLDEKDLATCGSLRQVVCSGEALGVDVQELFLERLDAELHNLYGPTEASVDVTFWKCTRDAERRSVPIGHPIANTQIYVLDDAGQPVPVGIAGEIHIGGIGLARGYLNRAELTAERFVPDPFSEKPGARLYKTGDRGCYRADASIEFLGRLDHQVKVRGQRIELGEIETMLAAHPAVHDNIVIAREDQPGDKRLVAYLIAEDQSEVSATEMRSYLSERLPEYMIPAVFIWLAEMPLTANGKLDRRALPAPGRERPAPEVSYIAPGTATEVLLANIWADVLGLDRVGVEDNFFALGGDSIRSVRVLAQAREQGLEVSLQQLFRHQTIAALAREIKGIEPAADPLPRTAPFDLISIRDRALLPPGLVDAYPVTMLQGGMLFHMALAPETAVYHNLNSWHLRAPFDRDCFEAAVACAVARHPILRTSFDLTSYSEPLQLVHETATLHVGISDLRQLSGEEQDEILDKFAEAERARRFNVSRPPLLRFHIHRRSDESFQFTLTESHPILDGWSLNSTLSEIFTRYFALLKGQAGPPEPSPSVSFRDFVLMERQTLEAEEHKAFWEEKLRGLNVTRLPRLPALYRNEGSRRIRQEHFLISQQLSDDLDVVARSLKVPVKSLLLAAHMKVLSLLSGETDVVSGLLTNGRPEALDGEQVRGLFLNTLPFRLLIPDCSWADLVRAAFEAEWELLPHRRYPLLALQRQMGGQPLFEAQFNFVHFHVLESVLSSGEFEVLVDVKKRVFEEAHFTLTANFSLSLFSSQINLMLQYDAAEMTQAQVQSIGGYFIETLRRIAEKPAERHEAHVLLPESERRQLLVGWNDTARDYALDHCLHELFEAQVARTPEAVAVVTDSESFIYSELNGRANQVARHLRHLGVGPDVRVAILSERSCETIVGLLGILKAGAAYVPLDPDYPRERIRFMLEDCGATVLLTDSRLAESLPECSARVVCLDDGNKDISQQSRENLGRSASPDDLAYVIYTSGSTGKPKGAMLPHRGVVNCIAWMQETYGLTAYDRFLCKTTLNFDPSVWEIFWPLMYGASLMVARHNGQRDAAYLAGAIVRHGITVTYFVPSLLALFIEEPRLAEASSLRKVICGGESLSADTVQSFYGQLPQAELHHSYGPTETSIAAADFVCPRESAWQVMPLGRPLGNNQLYILDRQMRPVPVGVTGDLYIGGAGLARGYNGLPGLTADKFIPNPFAAASGSRLYRTGDLARYLPDGLLEFRGRADSQIKLHGTRIELGEIEAALREHADVDQCVVILRGEGMEAMLVAYVVPVEGTSPGADELRSHLALRLPRQLVPTAFVTLEQLPLMVNGKIDRHALPDTSAEPRVVAAAFVAPANELERTIAGIWSEVLGLKQVGTQENFFDLGGHSLRLLQMHLKLRQAIGRDVPLFELFQYPTVSTLAAHLHAGEEESLDSSEERGVRRKKSAAQRRMHRDAARAQKAH